MLITLKDQFHQNSKSSKMHRVICKMCVILSLWLVPANNIANAKRILVITYGPFYSHQIVFRSLCLALNKRGHEIITLTTLPMRDSTLKNYTEIDLLSTRMSFLKKFKAEFSQLINDDDSELGKYILNKINVFTDMIFDDPKFKELYRKDSNEKFDAVIVEATSSPAVFTMAYRFNAPLIGEMSSESGMYKISNDMYIQEETVNIFRDVCIA